MSQNLICPIWSIQSAEPCERSSCAWWDNQDDRCSIVTIAIELKKFNDSIDEFDEVEVEKC